MKGEKFQFMDQNGDRTCDCNLAGVQNRAMDQDRTRSQDRSCDGTGDMARLMQGAGNGL
jgi:hypothetical protein